jgi:hypothetical protein
MDPHAFRVHPHQALAVYVEALAAGARVGVLGDASLGVADRLAASGARSVHLWDPDIERALVEGRRAPEGVEVLPYSLQEAAVRPFDLVIVPDLGLFDDPAEVIARTRVMVGDAGVALIRAVNGEADAGETANTFDYYELFDLVAASFSGVRMVGQLAFQGTALVALGENDESPLVTVDTQLAEGDRAVSAFVAVASQGEVSTEAYSIIELPPPATDDADTDTDTDGIREALADAELRTRALEREVLDHAARSAELEMALAARTQQVSELFLEAEEARAVAQAGRIVAAEVEAMTHRSNRADRRSALLEQELAAAIDTHATELLRFEDALRERAQAVRRLEAELERREGIVRDLVGTLEESALPTQPPPADVVPMSPPMNEPAVESSSAALAENARLRQQLDALALDLARREGEARATAWSVAELERRLEEVTSSGQAANPAPAVVPPPAGNGEGPRESGTGIARALDEIDALRRALAQEHERRVRAESGDALTQARADIQRLTVLVDQMALDRAPSGPSAPGPE